MPKKIDTKEKIRKAALDLFTKYPYDKITVDDIAKKAKVSKGGVFHYYDSKYDLALDVFRWFLEKQTGDFLTEEYLKKTPPEQQIQKFIDISFELIIENIKLSRFFMDILEETIHQKRNMNVTIDFLLQYSHFVEVNYVKMKVKNPQEKALLLMSALDGFALYYMFLKQSGHPVDIKKIKNEIYNLYIENV